MGLQDRQLQLVKELRAKIKIANEKLANQKPAKTETVYLTDERILNLLRGLSNKVDRLQHAISQVEDRVVLTSKMTGKEKDPQYLTLTEEFKPGEIYIGEAKPGSNERQPVWRIQKVTAYGKLISTEWADGNENFDKSWGDRHLLDYS